MSDREKCVVCGFPLATTTEYANAPNDLRDDARGLCWHKWTDNHRGPAIDWHAQALEADGRAACFEAAANDYKARVEALEGALRYLRRHFVCRCDTAYTSRQRHAPECLAYELADIDAALDAALSTTPPKRVKSLDEAPAWLDDGDEEPGGTFAYAPPRPDATEALRVAREALEATSVATFPYTDKGNAAYRLCGAALELLRAHVEPTPLEAAVAEVTR